MGVDRQEWVGQTSSVSENVVGAHEENRVWICTPPPKHVALVECTVSSAVYFSCSANLHLHPLPVIASLE